MNERNQTEDSPDSGDLHQRGGSIRTLFVSLLGAVALTAGLMVLKHQRREELETGVRITTRTKRIPAGERLPRIADLERLRELGL